MHEDGGYRYTGRARLGRLTKQEIDFLMLGFMVRGERAEEQASRGGSRSRRRYSAPRRSTREAMTEYQAKIDARRDAGG